MSQGNALRVESTSRGSICYMRLSGIVDESFDPESFLSKVTGTKVILNLRSINRLTSFGVREWTSAMRELGTKAERVFFVECSPAIVSHLNMVANFSGTAQVLSVQAPFHCEACGGEAEQTHILRPSETVSLADTVCEQCQAPMKFDDDVESYFSFQSRAVQNRGGPDPSIEGLVKHFSAEPAKPAKVRSSEEAPAPNPRAPMMETQDPSRGGFLPASRPPKGSLMTVPLLAGLGIGAVMVLGGFVVFRGLGWGEDKKEPKNTGAQYAQLVSEGRFARASAQLSMMEKDRAVTSDDATRMREALVEKAVSGYRERLELEQFSEADSMAAELEREPTLPSGLRARFNHEIAMVREKKSSDLTASALESFAAQAHEKVISIGKRASMFGPLSVEVTFAVAESYRLKGDMEAAAGHYANFVEMVDGDRPPDPRLDDALLWRASHLAKTGKSSEAEKLVRRLLALEVSDLKESASSLLEAILAEQGRTRSPP